MFPKEVFVRAVGAEGARVAMASPYFGRSINPISTRAADYTPPLFSDLPTVLFVVSPSPLIDLGDSRGINPPPAIQIIVDGVCTFTGYFSAKCQI